MIPKLDIFSLFNIRNWFFLIWAKLGKIMKEHDYGTVISAWDFSSYSYFGSMPLLLLVLFLKVLIPPVCKLIPEQKWVVKFLRGKLILRLKRTLLSSQICLRTIPSCDLFLKIGNSGEKGCEITKCFNFISFVKWKKYSFLKI